MAEKKNRIIGILLLLVTLALLSVSIPGLIPVRSQNVTERKTRDENNRVILTEYIDDEGNPVQKSGYYAVARSYNEKGQNDWLVYLDKNGEPILNTSGYAMVRREYNDAGKVERELYFDTEGHSAAASLGQYGIRKEYNGDGKLTRTIYLDAEGQPMENRQGCASERRSYREDGSLERINYFDLEDRPTSVGVLRFGTLYENGSQIYLDEDGEPSFRPDQFLMGRPILVLVCGLILMAAAILAKGKGRTLLLIAYLLFIWMMTFGFRESGDPRSRLELFWSYRQFLTSRELRQEIVYNIWLFVPLGALLYRKGSKRWMIPILLTVVIETLQYLTGYGLCEIDDVISNSLGGLIGYFAAGWIGELRSRKAKTI